MVSGGTVRGDASSLEQALTSYSSEISGLSGSWKGSSHDSLTSKAESFASEYSGTIKGEMEAFATACDLYEQYIEAKRKRDEEKARDGTLKETLGDGTKVYWDCTDVINQYQQEMDNLKGQIESNLATASASTLTATATSAGSSAGGGSSQSDGKSSSTSAASSTAPATNATMQGVADYAVSASGGGYDGSCERWAEVTWENATGITRQNQEGAYQAWEQFGVSESRDNIPVGAMVYGSGSGSDGAQWGHVGIYVGDGMVADQGGVTDIDSWVSWQTADCHGHTGWIGWGWQNNIDLSKEN